MLILARAFGILAGQRLRGTTGVAQAEAPAGAAAAVRPPVGAAKSSTQLHQCLGKISCPGRIHPGQCLLHLFLEGGGVNGRAVRRQPGHQPQHIAVHRRGAQIKANGADGTGGVVADPRQSPDGGMVGGEYTPVPRQDHLGGLLQIPHPAVVPKTFPELVQVVIRAGRQRADVRQGGQKAGVIAHHGLHPGLLQHDLREPYMVRLPIPPPGQITVKAVVPGQQRPRQPGQYMFHGGTSCGFAYCTIGKLPCQGSTAFDNGPAICYNSPNYR